MAPGARGLKDAVKDAGETARSEGPFQETVMPTKKEILFAVGLVMATLFVVGVQVGLWAAHHPGVL